MTEPKFKEITDFETIINFIENLPGGVVISHPNIMVDSLRPPLEIVVTAANVADSEGLKLLLERIQKRSLDLSRLFLIYVDGGYKGFDLVKWVMDTFGWILDMVLRPQEQKGFVVLSRRWVVERTFGWFYWCRRLSRDYEGLTSTG